MRRGAADGVEGQANVTGWMRRQGAWLCKGETPQDEREQETYKCTPLSAALLEACNVTDIGIKRQRSLRNFFFFTVYFIVVSIRYYFLLCLIALLIWPRVHSTVRLGVVQDGLVQITAEKACLSMCSEMENGVCYIKTVITQVTTSWVTKSHIKIVLTRHAAIK